MLSSLVSFSPKMSSLIASSHPKNECYLLLKPKLFREFQFTQVFAVSATPFIPLLMKHSTVNSVQELITLPQDYIPGLVVGLSGLFHFCRFWGLKISFSGYPGSFRLQEGTFALNPLFFCQLPYAVTLSWISFIAAYVIQPHEHFIRERVCPLVVCGRT